MISLFIAFLLVKLTYLLEASDLVNQIMTYLYTNIICVSLGLPQNYFTGEILKVRNRERK